MGILCNKGQLDGSQSEKRKTNHNAVGYKILNKKYVVAKSCFSLLWTF